MKVTIKGELLTKTLRRTLLSSASPLNPAHALVKIEAKKKKGDEPGSLTFSTTAGAIAINTIALADVTEEGTLATNARLICTASGAMPDGDILLTSDDKRVRLKGSSGRTWSGATVDHSAMQPTPEPKDAAWLKVPAEALRTAIERLDYVTHEVEKYKEAQTGIRIEGTADKVTAIAIGQYMFAAFEQKIPGLSVKGDKWAALMPTQALPAINDVIAEAIEMKAETVELYVDHSQLYVIGPATLFVAALPIGDYPPWEFAFMNFPKEAMFTVQRIPLMESIKACEATSGRLDPGAIFRVTRNALELSRDDGQTDFNEVVPVRDMQPGTDLKFKCNSHYIFSMLKAAGEDAGLHFDSECKTVLMRAPGYQAVCSLMVQAPPGPPPDEKGSKKK